MGESPIFIIPISKFLGQSGDGDKVWKNFGDFLGTGMGLILSFFLGSIPKNPPKTGMGTGKEPPKGLGILWGRGRLKLWGFFGGKSPKNLKKRGGDGGRILGDFAHPSLYEPGTMGQKKLELRAGHP